MCATITKPSLAFFYFSKMFPSAPTKKSNIIQEPLTLYVEVKWFKVLAASSQISGSCSKSEMETHNFSHQSPLLFGKRLNEKVEFGGSIQLGEGKCLPGE